MAPGLVFMAKLPERVPQGREQEKPRPVVVVATPGDGAWGPARFGPLMVLVVPLTSEKGLAFPAKAPKLYPKLTAGQGGLPQASVALLDQAVSYDLGRGLRVLGQLSPTELEALRAPLRQMLGG